MFIANIEVVPEYQTGVGNLDFMFLGHVKGEGSARLCAEFKNAHSKDIFNGFTTQLPLYMRNSGAEYGAYCVLSYKGIGSTNLRKPLRFRRPRSGQSP